MKINLSKMVCFLLTFLLGSFSVLVISLKTVFWNQISNTEIKNQVIKSVDNLKFESINLKIESLKKTKYGWTLTLTGTNNTRKSVFYSGYDKQNPIRDFMVDGVEKENWVCGTGLKEIELKPNETIEFEVYENELIYNLGKGEVLQIGLEFREKNDKSFGKFWSQPIVISANHLKQMKKILIGKTFFYE